MLNINGGFAMTHVEDYKKVTRRNMETGNTYTEVAPIVMLDIALRIQGERDHQVNIGDVRSLVYELQANGFNIAKVTFDQFQSADSIQQLNSRGIESGNLSVDSKLDPYNSFKDSMYEDRLIMYNYLPAIEEATRLEKNEIKNKVDHPPSSTKDVTDAIAGAIFHAVTSPIRSGSIIERGVTEAKTAEERKREETYKHKDMVDIYLDGDTDDLYHTGYSSSDVYQYRSLFNRGM